MNRLLSCIALCGVALLIAFPQVVAQEADGVTASLDDLPLAGEPAHGVLANQAQPAHPENLLSKHELAGCELHVVGMYMPEDSNTDDRIYVEVKPTSKPVVLVMTGYMGAQWHVTIDPEADVRQIIIPGYYKHEIAEPRPDVPIAFLTYFPNADKRSRDFFWAYAWHTSEGRELRRKLKEITGLEVTTFQGKYQARNFVVDGKRGDVMNLEVTGAQDEVVRPATTPPSALVTSAGANSAEEYMRIELVKAELEKDILARQVGPDHPRLLAVDRKIRLLREKLAEFEDRRSDASADFAEPKARAISGLRKVDRKQLKRQRASMEQSYRESEQASAAAAAAYRNEASQKSPDADALKDIRQRLQVEVARAFEAQSTLQRLRIQLAELDLQDVNAKHQRRQPLANKIIARRIADLMTGEDLQWQQARTDSAEPESSDVSVAVIETGESIPVEPDAKPAGTNSESDKAVDLGTLPAVALLNFTASYCSPCQQMVPLLKRMERDGYPIHSVDVTQSPEITRQYKVDVIPTLILMVDGNETQRFVGRTSEERLRTVMQTAARNRPDPRLDGEWKLQTVKGPAGTTAHEYNLKLRSETHRYTMLRTNQSTDLRLQISTAVSPHTIDVTHPDLPGSPTVFSGIYKIHGDTLTIAFAPSVGTASRPTDFSGSTGTVQTFVRVSPVPTFATPQELVDYLKQNGGKDGDASFDHYAALMTDDEIKRFAGAMLRTASMMQMVAGLGATFGAENPNGDATGLLQVVGELNLLVQNHRLSDPPPEAQAAFQEISANMGQLLTAAGGPALIDAASYSKKLRTASGILKDPSEFLIDVMSAMAAMSNKYSRDTDGKKKPANWQVTVDGDTAIAVNRTDDAEATGDVTNPQEMRLVKIGDTWKISSLIPDRMIMEIQQGARVSESSSDASSAIPPSPAPAASFQPYPQPPPGVIGTIATRDIEPFTKLQSGPEANVRPVLVNSEEGRLSAVPLDEVRGKYVNRQVASNESITRDMLIDEPTTQQFADFWLTEAVEGRGVFDSMRSLSDRYHESHLYKMEYPFSASYAERFNRKLPAWTSEYLTSLQDRLNATPVEEWTQGELNLLKSVAEMIHYQTVNEHHDLAGIGELLAEFIRLNADTDSASANEDIRKAAHSSLILSLAARLNGGLQPEVLKVEPTDPAIVGRLQLLKTMKENRADSTWVSQERRRLFGLLEEAPVQALTLLLTSGPVEDAGIEDWIFAMSSEQTYDAWRSSPGERFSPPVDTVLMIAIAELLTGQSQTTDDNLSMIFNRQHPGNMFSRHLDDLLASELAYRESVLQSLVAIYDRSKSESLRTNIALVAPAVPVMAESRSDAEATGHEGDSPECEIWGLPLRSVSGGHGMLVMACPVDNPIHESGLRKGDILRGIGDLETRSAEDLKFVIEKLQERNTWTTTFLIERRGKQLTLGPLDVPPIPATPSNEDSLLSGNDLSRETSASSATGGTSSGVGSAAAPTRTQLKKPQMERNLLQDWLKQARALGENAQEKRDAAIAEIEAALHTDDPTQLLAATTALAQLGDVKFDKAKFRPRLLELCRSEHGGVQTFAFYALYNTDRRDGDLPLLQDILAEPHSSELDQSASHLLQLFGDGSLAGKSETILLQLLDSSDRGLRREALRGLWGAKFSDKVTERIIKLVDNAESHHDAIYYALSTMPEKNAAATDKLIEVLSDPDWNNWDRALWGLGYGVPESQQQKVADAMLQMYELRSDPKTRQKCAKLVQQYGNEEQKRRLNEVAAVSDDADLRSETVGQP